MYPIEWVSFTTDEGEPILVNMRKAALIATLSPGVCAVEFSDGSRYRVRCELQYLALMAGALIVEPSA